METELIAIQTIMTIVGSIYRCELHSYYIIMLPHRKSYVMTKYYRINPTIMSFHHCYNSLHHSGRIRLCLTVKVSNNKNCRLRNLNQALLPGRLTLSVYKTKMTEINKKTNKNQASAGRGDVNLKSVLLWPVCSGERQGSSNFITPSRLEEA